MCCLLIGMIEISEPPTRDLFDGDAGGVKILKTTLPLLFIRYAVLVQEMMEFFFPKGLPICSFSVGP